MVTNINHQELLDLRNKIMDIILDNLNSWDGEMESGIKIIEDNQVEIDKLETLNLQLSRFPTAHKEEYINKINLVIAEQRKMNKVIKNIQKSLLENMQQMSKKDQVIKSYININKGSVFIDKDIR